MPSLPPLRIFLRQLDLASLDLFALVCETGSIARAAERGGIATSALSRRLAELEAAVGGALLVRHARGARPTLLGQEVLGHVVDILLGVERLRGELDAYAQGVRGRVRLAASASAVEQFLPGDITAFAHAHPDIRIDLNQGSSQMVAAAVLEGAADLGVCGACDLAARLQVRPYRLEQLVLVMQPGHPLAGTERLLFADALDFDQVGIRGSSTVQAHLNRAAREARRVLRQRVEVNSLSAMCRMIECGMGVGVMAEGAFRALRAPSLHAVALADAWALRTLNLYALDFSTLPVPARSLADALAEG